LNFDNKGENKYQFIFPVKGFLKTRYNVLILSGKVVFNFVDFSIRQSKEVLKQELEIS